MSEINLSSWQNAKKLLVDYQNKLNPVIDEYFDEQIKNVSETYPPHSVKALEVYRDICTRGGKRARGAFSYYVYKMYGGQNDTEAIKMGIVLELIHAYLLLLDDFMDLSETRRHGPTGHKLFSKYFEDQNFANPKINSKHFGDSIAVTTAALGAHMALRLLNSVDFSSDIKISLSNNLNEKLVTTGHGQITDVVNGFNPNVTEEDVLKMLEWKTGVYTYENPIHTGAIMAGITDKSQFKILSDYAISAGVAFQIQDDILGVFGSSDDTGKSVYDDLREGKYTLLAHFALKNGSEDQIQKLKLILGNPEIGDIELAEAKKIFVESGSLEYSKKTALNLVNKAKESLQKNKSENWQQIGYEYLLGIADYMIERSL